MYPDGLDKTEIECYFADFLVLVLMQAIGVGQNCHGEFNYRL